MQEKIFISRRFFEETISEKLKGYKVEFWNEDEAPTKEELIEKCSGASAILSMLSDPIDKEFIERVSDKLKVISNYAVGYNNIDVASASANEIVVTNTPEVLTDAVAELVVGMMISLGRNFEAGINEVREGRFKGWSPAGALGKQIKGSKVGIVGMGRIGQAITERLRPFGAELLYYNRTQKPGLEKKFEMTYCSADQLFQQADFIILALSLSEETHHILNKKRLQSLKKEAFVINIGRGALIDEQTMIECLESKNMGGAALDVYEQEPFIPERLRQLDNVLLLPHIGSSTDTTRLEMLNLALDNILLVLKGKEAKTPVNKYQK